MAVEVKDTPDAALLACPVAADGFPAGSAAMMPPAVRNSLIGLAAAYSATRDQLLRLIRWHNPGACACACAGEGITNAQG